MTWIFFGSSFINIYKILNRFLYCYNDLSLINSIKVEATIIFFRSSRIRDFDVKARNCLFDDERDEPNSEVTMFKHYSEENCMLECRAKLLMDKCGCLPYYYPRLDILLDFDLVWKNSMGCLLWQLKAIAKKLRKC